MIKRCFRLPTTVDQYLQVIAEELNVSPSALIRGVLIDYINEIRQDTEYYLDDRIPDLN